MIISVVGVVLVAVFSNTGSCSKDMTELNNSTSINTSAVIYYSGENNMLGHIHRGSSCTEKSTFPGYIVSMFMIETNCTLPPPPPPPSLSRHCSLV